MSCVPSSSLLLLPTADGADVEDVVLQVGLDGVRVYDSNGVATDGASRAFPLERVASWRTLDPTVFVVVVVATSAPRPCDYLRSR